MDKPKRIINQEITEDIQTKDIITTTTLPSSVSLSKQVKAASSENQQVKQHENDLVMIKKETNKPTTKIKIKINHEEHQENRVIYIAKPPYLVTLHDVKEYLEKKPFFDFL